MKGLPIRRFWSLLSQYKAEIRQIYVYAVFIGMVNLTLPLGIQAIINFLQTGEFTSTWIILVGFVLAGIAIAGILQILQLRVVENIQQDLFARSGFEFAYRIPKIEFFRFDKVHAPELANRFFDTLTIQKGLPKILIDFSLAIFQIVFGLILLATYSPYFLILGVSLAFIIWLVFRITGPSGVRTSLKESSYKYQLAHWLEEIALVNRTFKLNTSSDFHLDKTDKIVGKYLGARESHFQVLLNQFRSFIGFKVILAAGLLLLGGFLVFNDHLNIGQFVAAEIIIILIINSVEKVLLVIETIYDVLTSLEKIGYITDLDLDKSYGKAASQGTDGFAVEVDEIQFSFPNESRNILENLSFKLESADKAILKGVSGSGKTVLLQILAGIHKSNKGEIYFDGIPLESYDRDGLLNKMGIILPSNQLFEGSFRENILLGRDIEEQELVTVLKALNLFDFIIHHPLGLETKIDSGGRSIPRSVIEKMIIARTIIGKPKLLLMEDPLHFTDKEEKIRIIDYLMEHQKATTILVISDFDYWRQRCNKTIELTK